MTERPCRVLVLGDPVNAFAAALARADVLAILVPHRAFRLLDPARLRGRPVVDAVGLLAD